MVAGGQPVRLGPFIGGLNIASDPTAIADAELAICENLELDIDGSLKSRPPYRELEGSTSWTERIVMLCEGVFGSSHYLIGSNANGVFHYLAGTWTLITSTFQASAAVQYADFIYLVPKPGSGDGGKWSPGGGFTAVAAIPKGQACVIHKERLFVVPGIEATADTSRLKFSNAGNFDTWGGSDFIDVGQGDGSKLIEVTVFQDNLILFKNNSTYVLSYDTRPAEAVLRKISLTIGVNGQFCMVNYENQVYIFHGQWIYEIINYDFQRLNVKVPFERDDTAPSPFASESVFLTLLEDRLVCRYYAKTYIYGLRTRTWSEWSSVRNELQYFGPIQTIRPLTGNEYYSGSSITAYKSVIQFVNESTASTTERTLIPTPSIADTFTRTTVDAWGTTDTGQIWACTGGVAANFSTDGTKGIVALSTLNVTRFCDLPISYTDGDWTGTVAASAVATGASMQSRLRCRWIDASNFYTILVTFATTGQVGISLFKTVAGAVTSLASNVDIGTYSASEIIAYRFQVNGTTIRGKLWKAASSEPVAWTVSATDGALTLPGSVEIASIANTSNTNTNPSITYDSINIGLMTAVAQIITCSVKTKNFDMAISHQFKRLWWWGADVSTDNDIVGIATPITKSFRVTWGMLAGHSWASLNTWAQPLSTASSITTTATTGTGTARRFAKFMKGLRYRQINFEVRLTTEGSTVDGPARLFTMTIITESKQVVPATVN